MKTNHFVIGLFIFASLTASAQAAVTMVSGLFIPFTKIVGPRKNVPVDFDGDGTAELNFVGQYTAESDVIPASTNVEVQGIPATPPNLGGDVWRMGVSTSVSSTPATFAQWNYNPYGLNFIACYDIGCAGLWQDFDDPYWDYIVDYLGVRFMKEDGWHYGWVEVRVQSNAGAFVQGYAWETTPNTPILTPAVVPEPQRAGLVLAGSLALLLRRRRPVSISRREAAGLLSLAMVAPNRRPSTALIPRSR